MTPQIPGVETAATGVEPQAPIAPVQTAPAAPENTPGTPDGPKTFGDLQRPVSPSPDLAAPTSEAADSAPPKEDTRDFRGYAKNLEQQTKSMRQTVAEQQAEIKRLQSLAQPAVTPLPSIPAPPVPGQAVSEDDQQALQILESAIDRVMERKLGPVVGELTQQQEQRVWTDFEAQPYVQQMQPEIIQEFNQMDPSLPLQQRLELSRALAIAKNLPTIVQVNQEVAADKAMQQAYANQDLKRSQVGPDARPSNAMQPTDNFLERIKSGQVTAREIHERRPEYDELIKQDTFSSA